MVITNLDHTCAICLADLRTTFARNICRHRFHQECLKAYFDALPSIETARCPCCREEFPDRIAFNFNYRTTTNTANHEENVNELNYIIHKRKTMLPKNARTEAKEMKYLRLKKHSMKLVKQTQLEMKKWRLGLVEKLFKHIENDPKCQYLVENLDKVCACSAMKTFSKKTLLILERHMKLKNEDRMSRSEEAQSVSTDESPNHEISQMSLSDFSPEELCPSCNLARLPIKIMEYYVLDGFKLQMDKLY